MSIKDCLAKLVKTKAITPAAAKEAEALWRRYQNKFSLDHSPAQAEAAAALEAARVMQATSRQMKHSVAMQVQRQTAVEQIAQSHPFGPAAGGMAVLTRDIYRTGARNVDSRVSSVRQTLFSMFDTALEAFSSKAAGLQKDTVGAWQMVGELFGVESGNPVAKTAASGWEKATTYAVKRVQEAGKRFEEMESWRLPQAWNGDRVRRIGTEEFLTDARNAVQSGGLRIFDKEVQDFATKADRIEVLLRKAASDIVTEAGSAPVFSKEMRTFHFQPGDNGFAAFKQLQGKYGAGNDVMQVLTGHLNGMAQEIGLVEMLGPSHRATAAMLVKNARQWERAGKEGQGRVRAARLLGQESSGAIDRTYKVLSGEANGVESSAWAGFLGTMRSLMTASSLGSAVIPAVIGDTVTLALAARANGMPALQVIGRAMRAAFGEGQIDREAAAHLLVSGHAMSDHAIGASRYLDEINTPQLARRVSDFVLRASGMNAWTEGAKKTFSMDMLNFIGRNVAHAIDHVPPAFKAFLDRYKISAAEWDHLRAQPLYDLRGAKYFDSSLATKDRAAEKLFEGILEERALAVLETDARVRGFVTQGGKAGTLAGELGRAGMMFQSFSMTMANTHLHALFVKDGLFGNVVGNRVAFFISHLVAGIAIVQARQVLQGKDPIDMMHHPKFWFQAAVQGGGLGYFGDLIAGTTDAADRSWSSKMSGPLGGMADDALRFGHAVVTGKPGAIGKGIDLTKHFIPGSNLWFIRGATDRLIFDQLHRAIDPTYSQSFARREQRAQKEYGQGYWWHQGETAPARAPGLSAAFGGG